MKTIRYLFLSVALALTALTAGADVTFENGKLKYKITDASPDYAQVVGVSSAGESATSLTIPSTVTYNGTTYRISQIGYQAFKGNTKITSVSISWGAYIMLNEAFANCTNLTTVYLPSSLLWGSIYQSTFAGCSKLKEVYASAIEGKALAYANNFPANSGMTLYIPNGCKTSTADYKALAGWSNFANVQSSKSAYDFAYFNTTSNSFYYVCFNEWDNKKFSDWGYRDVTVVDCSSHVQNESFTFNPGQTVSFNSGFRLRTVAIAAKAAKGNTDIVGVNLSGYSNLTSIGASAFEGCTNLTSATVRAQEIGNFAFSGCTKLSSLTLEEGITKLGQQMIAGTPLTVFNFPASVTSFNYAADGAKNLSSIVPASGSATYSAYYGTLYNKNQTLLVRQPEGRGLVSFPDAVSAIGAYAFENCTKLQEEIELPYGVTSIGSYAFSGATGMKKLVIPSSVASISSGMLIRCSGLTDLYINKATAPTATMSNLFGSDYASIVPNVTLHLPYASGIDTSYKNAGWTGFKEYNMGLLQAYDFAVNLENFGKAYYSVTSSGASNYQREDGVWAGYNGTVKLLRGTGTAPNGTVTIPDVVTYKNKRYGITSLGTLSLYGDGTSVCRFSIAGGWLVNKIEYGAGAFTTALTGVDLPNVTVIDQAAFSLSLGLKSFTFSPKLTDIGDAAFNGATALEQDVYLPYGVKTVGASAFANSAITTLRIPSSVTKLGDMFVSNNSKLVELIVNTPTTALAAGSTEIYTMPDNMRVYVPVGQVEQFKQHKAFTRYTSKIEAGAFDFIWGNDYDTYYHMSVMTMLSGEFTDPETGEKTAYDGWAKYVYHPAITPAREFQVDYIETDQVTGKKFLMVALGDSVFAGAADMSEFIGPTSILLQIGHHAFYGSAVRHALSFDNPLSIGEFAFAEMPNCPSVTILSPLDLSGSFKDSYIFDHNMDGFKFYVDNKYFKKAVDYCWDWDMGDGYYAAQLRPFIRAEAEVQPVSCFLEWVNYPENGLHAYSVNSYDESKQTLKLLEHDENFLNNQEHGVILTDLQPGEIYKLEPSDVDPATVTCSGDIDNYLTENWETSTLKSDDALKRWGWDAENKKFVHPASSMTIPGGSALLYIGDSDPALNIDEWTLELAASNKFDVNNDTKVDVGDVNAILEAILAGNNDAKFNVNGDTGVDVGDVNAVLEYILTH